MLPSPSRATDVRLLSCPITMRVMTDPVVLVSCGHTFDRQSIHQWKRGGGSRGCPLCRAHISGAGLVPNYLARDLIEAQMPGTIRETRPAKWTIEVTSASGLSVQLRVKATTKWSRIRTACRQRFGANVVFKRDGTTIRGDNNSTCEKLELFDGARIRAEEQ